LNFVPCWVPTNPTELVSGTTVQGAANALAPSARPATTQRGFRQSDIFMIHFLAGPNLSSVQ
jgi:hypothetical protein